MTLKRAPLYLMPVAAMAVALSAHADQSVRLGVKLGLWQLTTQAQVTGALPPQLQQSLQNMPAAARQKVEAEVQAVMANAQRVHVFKKCMTQKSLADGFDTGNESGHCTSTVVRNTDTDFEYHKVCHSNAGEHTENVVFHLVDPHHVTGTIDVVKTGKPHPMTVHDTVSGKWLGSSCGNVKDSELVK